MYTGLRPSLQWRPRWFQEPVVFGNRQLLVGKGPLPEIGSMETKQEQRAHRPRMGVGGGHCEEMIWPEHAQQGRVKNTPGQRNLRLEEVRRNLGRIQSRTGESRRAACEEAELVRGPGRKANSSNAGAGVGTRESWATALVSGGCEESSVHCNLGIECGTQPARTLFPLRDPRWPGAEPWSTGKKRQAYVLKAKQVGLVPQMYWHVTSAAPDSLTGRICAFLLTGWEGSGLSGMRQGMESLEKHEEQQLGHKVTV